MADKKASEYRVKPANNANYEIWKDGKKAYNCNGQVCDCPSGHYRGYCKHMGMVNEYKEDHQLQNHYTHKFLTEIISKLHNTVLKGQKYDVAGSYRRKKPRSKNLDIVVEGNHSRMVLNKLRKFYPHGDTEDDDTRRAVPRTDRRIQWVVDEMLQVNFHFILEISQYDAGLMYFTGSSEFNVKVRKKASSLGYRLDRYGLHNKANKLLCSDEQTIFDLLQMDYVPPEKRD